MNKLLTIILMLSLSLALGSCSDDDKEDDNGGGTPPEYYNPLEGTWVKDNDHTLRVVFTNEFQWKMEWFENGKWGYPEIKGKYTIDKKQSTFKSKGVIYHFAIDGDKLTLNYPAGPVYYTKYKEE